MTADRLAALKRLREAQGKEYDGCITDAYEMFLVVDECFRNCETETVATWLPYTPETVIGDGEYLFAIRDQLTPEHRHIYRVWNAKWLKANCLADQIDWYMPLTPSKLPAMKIQENAQ